MEKENLVECHFCGEEVEENQLTSLGGEEMCTQCVDDHFVCYECGSIHHNDDMSSLGYNSYCESCADELIECSNCGDVVWRDDAREFDYEHYCYDCYQDVNPIKSYSYKISTRYNGSEKPQFGVELEVECLNENPIDVASSILQLDTSERYFVLKDDGSITSGFEFVTVPASLKFHKENFPWKRVLDRMKAEDCHNEDYEGYPSCGMHVHISRDELSDQDVGKIALLINGNRALFEQLFRRKGSGYASYVDPYEVKQLVESRSRYLSPGRSYAVNTEPRSTVEIRAPKSTIELNDVMGTLEMLHGMVSFVKQFPIGRFLSDWTEMMNLFLQSFTGNGTYQYVENYFRKYIRSAI